MHSRLRQYLLILSIGVLVAGVTLFLVKFLPYLTGREEITIEPWVRPAFLNLPLPKIENIKKAINNPLFQELEYREKYFAPVIPGAKGRPNPFAPF